MATKVITISNSLNRPVVCNYRMPGRQSNGQPYPFITFTVQPRAMLNKVEFATEEHYEAWRKQCSLFINKGYLIEGKISEKNIIKESEKVSARETASISERIDKTVDSVKQQAKRTGSKSSLKITVEKA